MWLGEGRRPPFFTSHQHAALFAANIPLGGKVIPCLKLQWSVIPVHLLVAWNVVVDGAVDVLPVLVVVVIVVVVVLVDRRIGRTRTPRRRKWQTIVAATVGEAMRMMLLVVVVARVCPFFFVQWNVARPPMGRRQSMAIAAKATAARERNVPR